MSEAVLYLDYMSQPSRACAIFISMNQLPVKMQKLFIHKGDTRAEEYRAKNPLGKVPFLEDGELLLPESAAILVYLATKYNVPQHWYPRSDLAAQARVNAALHWYHSTVRAGAARVVFNTVVAIRLGRTPNKAYAEEGRELLALALRQLSSYWLLSGGRPFMTGAEVSLPDLLCCCELEQLSMMDKAKHGTDLEDQQQQFPVVHAWMERVQSRCSPVYEEIHKTLRVAAAGSRSRSRM